MRHSRPTVLQIDQLLFTHYYRKNLKAFAVRLSVNLIQLHSSGFIGTALMILLKAYGSYLHKPLCKLLY